MAKEIQKTGNPFKLISPAKWQRLQDSFAKIIGVNIAFVDAKGRPIVKSNPVSVALSDIVVPVEGALPKDPPDEVVKAVRQGWTTQKCRGMTLHGLHYCLLHISWQGKVLGAFVIGPVLVGKREDEMHYRKICEEARLDASAYLDRIHEVRLYSHVGLFMVLDFLFEMTEFFLKQAMLMPQIEKFIPRFLARMRGSKNELDMRYRQELLNALLDVSLELVNGDSGSVMLVDEEKQCFHIQAARGLKPDIVRSSQVPVQSGVAGLIAKRAKATLIAKETDDPELTQRLNKPGIKSSFVIPLSYKQQVLGLFCLNAESENKSFNPQNLTLLEKFSRVAGIALAGVSGN